MKKYILIFLTTIAAILAISFVKYFALHMIANGRLYHAEKYYCHCPIDSFIYKIEQIDSVSAANIQYFEDVKVFEYRYHSSDTVATLSFYVFKEYFGKTRIELYECFMHIDDYSIRYSINFPRQSYTLHQFAKNVFEQDILNRTGVKWHRNWLHYILFYRFPWEDPIYDYIYNP
jgi:hypothetical protein